MDETTARTATMLTQENIEKLKEQLASASTPARTKPLSKMGVMRALYDEIEAKSKGSWRHEDIVLWLKQQGVELSLNQFNRYLSDIRREKRLSGVESEIGLHNPKVQTPVSAPTSVKSSIAPAQAKPEKREEKPAAKAAPAAPVSSAVERVLPAQDAEEQDNVWNVKPPEVDAKGFVKQPHEK